MGKKQQPNKRWFKAEWKREFYTAVAYYFKKGGVSDKCMKLFNSNAIRDGKKKARETQCFYIQKVDTHFKRQTYM